MGGPCLKFPSAVTYGLWISMFSMLITLRVLATEPPGGLVREVPAFRGFDANLYMQTSAEYRAACFQAFHLAAMNLKQSLAALASNGPQPAVVLDLDETVLDNAAFQAWMLGTGVAYQQFCFDQWEQFGGEAVTLIPGAKEFILQTEQLGVRVIYISNRNERFRESTKKTLQRLGIPIRHDSQLKLSTTTSDKTARRLEVEQRDGCQVLLMIGDNLRDFDERFRAPELAANASVSERAAVVGYRKEQVNQTRERWGTHWIVLPNPAYGEWTKPLGRGLEDQNLLRDIGLPLVAAFWNVENLFDTVDDPTIDGDEEFTPTSPKQWTEERLNIKLDNLARVIRRMHQGKGPAVLGLAEIENRAVVEQLVAKLKPLGRDYQIVHQDSPSGRGIDCALIFDAETFQLKSSKFHFVDAEKTRDIVEAELIRGNASLTVFVNHWPARYHPEAFRIQAATTLRERVNQILSETPLADILLMGDFNDHPVDRSVAQTLNAVGKLQEVQAGTFFNTSFTQNADATTGTYVYDDKWQVLDQIIISPGLLIPGGVSWLIGSTQTVTLADDQIYHPTTGGIPRPSRSYSRDDFHANGYSDHLPVVTTVLWQSTTKAP